MKLWGGQEINIYHVKIKGDTCNYAICIKQFKVATEADNIFDEEQTLQIAKVTPPAHAAFKASVDTN